MGSSDAAFSAGEAAPAVTKTDDEWRATLEPAAYEVLRHAATERPFTGEYTDEFDDGIYYCRACGSELFTATAKFHSHCGWPSFYEPSAGDNVVLRTDRSMGTTRTEVLCRSCHSHLGHLFTGEGYPTPTDQRYCVNSVALRLARAEGATKGSSAMGSSGTGSD